MKRSKPLRSNPTRLRDWRQRSREKQIEKVLEQLQTTNPRRRREPSLRGFTQRVFTLYGRKCVVCGERAVQAHHAIPKRTIRARGGPEAGELVGDARNGVPVCTGCHERHEKAFRRIRRRELPAGVIEWAYEQGFGWLIDDPRVYPPGRPS